LQQLFKIPAPPSFLAAATALSHFLQEGGREVGKEAEDGRRERGRERKERE
jgi:hypothetical protein